jgi:hypothetical protein
MNELSDNKKKFYIFVLVKNGFLFFFVIFLSYISQISLKMCINLDCYESILSTK